MWPLTRRRRTSEARRPTFCSIACRASLIMVDASRNSPGPLVLPGERRFAEDRDIAFAASAVVDGDQIRLYCSIADRHAMRAIVRRG